MNDSIKNPEDVERYLKLNTLGLVPSFDAEETRKKGRKSKTRKRT